MRRLSVFIVLAFAGLFSGPAAAMATPAFDMRGTWNLNGYAITITTMDCGTGAFSGTGSGGAYTWTENGTLDGNAFTDTEVYNETVYSAFLTGTASSSDTITGTFKDSWRGDVVVGDFTMTRTSGPPSGGCIITPIPKGPDDPNKQPDPDKVPVTTDPGKHPTAVQVMCNYVILTSIDTCTATVGDAAQQPTSPTGMVTFEKTEGSFFGDGTCQLTTSPSAPSTGSCSVQYQRPFGSTKFPQIAANYGGDATHSAGRGATSFLILGGPPNFTSTFPNQVDFQTTAEADGTKVRTCATTGSKPGKKGKKSALAAYLRAAPGSSTGDTAIDEVIQAIQNASDAQTQVLLPAVDKALDKALTQLKQNAAEYQSKVGSSAPADQARVKILKAEIDSVKGTIELLQKAMEAGCKADSAAAKNAGGSRLATAARAAPSGRTAVVLGATTVKGAKAGPVAIKLKLGKKAVAKAVKGKKTLVVYIRIVTVTPSGLLKQGLPRMTVQKVSVGRDGKIVPSAAPPA